MKRVLWIMQKVVVYFVVGKLWEQIGKIDWKGSTLMYKSLRTSKHRTDGPFPSITTISEVDNELNLTINQK